MHDWQQLTELTQNKKISIERIKIIESGIAIDGDFELPPLAQLSMEDQIFVAAFVKSHGSIKDMEALYGVSYPSIKNRLNRISKAFDFIDITPQNTAGDILEDLEHGKISFDQALKALKK
ncbi:MAG: DUF2089 family protein [Desulfobacterales bacterium]|jgi:hypothetical protein